MKSSGPYAREGAHNAHVGAGAHTVGLGCSELLLSLLRIRTREGCGLIMGLVRAGAREGLD